MKRVHYFTGQLLSAGDFQAEQDYHLDRIRRLNLRTHGVGVVAGLEVSVHAGHIHILPGVAIDSRGNEIVVDAPQVLSLPAGSSPSQIVVALTYSEILTDLAPAFGEQEKCTQPTRIEEAFRLELLPVSLATDGARNHFALARLSRDNGTWKMEVRSGSILQLALALFGATLLCGFLFRPRRYRLGSRAI